LKRAERWLAVKSDCKSSPHQVGAISLILGMGEVKILVYIKL